MSLTKTTEVTKIAKLDENFEEKKKPEADNHPITSSFCVNKTGDLKREWPIVFC